MKKVSILKGLTVGISFLAIGLLLTGCGSSKKSSSESSSDVTEIRFSWWGGDTRHKATLNAIKLFEKENPDIKVKAEYSGYDGIVEKMTTQIAGGTEPDLMQVNYDWLVNYTPDGKGFYDLSKLSDLDLSGYSEDILKTGQVKGIQNAVPVSVNAYTLMINKTQYEKNGVAIPKTWDELLAAGKAFPDGQYPLYTSPYVGFVLATQYIQQKYGVPFITTDGDLGFSEAQVKEALEFYTSLVDNEVIPPAKEAVGEISGSTALNESPAFLSGKYAGLHEWSSQAQLDETALKNSDNQQLEFLGLPTQENMKDSGLSTKPAILFAISKNTKHVKETAKLLNFLLNDEEAVKELGLERGIPSNSNAEKILDSDGKITGISKTAQDYINTNMSSIPLSPYFEASNVTNAWGPLMDSYAYGELSSKDAAKQMYDGVKEALDGLKNN